MSISSRGKGKRMQNRQEMDKLNRTALYIGGAAAIVILVLILASFFMV